MVNSLSAFKEATTTLTRNMYIRGYEAGVMKQGWRTFVNKYGGQFSKSKRKDIVLWYGRMLR